LYCALSISKFNRIKSCKNARDIWHALEIWWGYNNQLNPNIKLAILKWVKKTLNLIIYLL
jgi:hypothetical protein